MSILGLKQTVHFCRGKTIKLQRLLSKTNQRWTPWLEQGQLLSLTQVESLMKYCENSLRTKCNVWNFFFIFLILTGHEKQTWWCMSLGYLNYLCVNVNKPQIYMVKQWIIAAARPDYEAKTQRQIWSPSKWWQLCVFNSPIGSISRENVMIMRSLSANPDAANPIRPSFDDDKREETVQCHKRKLLPHAQWLEFCLKWTAAWDCPTSCKVAKHLILTVYFSHFLHILLVPLCIVETMLGHHYPNADKSQQLVNYVEDYLECVESLPLDIQRNVSLLREIDAKYQGIVFTCFYR